MSSEKVSMLKTSVLYGFQNRYEGRFDGKTSSSKCSFVRFFRLNFFMLERDSPSWVFIISAQCKLLYYIIRAIMELKSLKFARLFTSIGMCLKISGKISSTSDFAFIIQESFFIYAIRFNCFPMLSNDANCFI